MRDDNYIANIHFIKIDSTNQNNNYNNKNNNIHHQTNLCH